MKHPENVLLKEILADENASEFCAGSLESMLAVARERRRRRRATRIACWAGLPVLVALVLALYMMMPPATPKLEVKPSPTVPSTPPPSILVRAEPSRVHYLTDEELLSLFPGRRVALVGRSGAQKLVFLDAKVQPTR